MSARDGQWTRRRFSQALAASAASSFLTRNAAALASNGQQGFAFVGTSTTDPFHGSIRLYRVNGSEWRLLDEVTAASPASLLLHPRLPMLYVVHDVSLWGNLPRGAVSVYAFDAALGRLSRRATQPLSLSATHPRHAIITADAHALLVAAQTGGIYNLLRITDDGGLGPVTAIRKELGVQDYGVAKVAEPGRMVLGATGSIFATDAGQETVTHFDVHRGNLTVRHRTRVHAGAGPSSLCMSSCEQRAYVMHATNGSLSMHDVSASGLSPAQTVLTLGDGTTSVLMHPEGRFLIAADEGSLRVLRVDSQTGSLSLQSRAPQPHLDLLHFTPGGMHMVGVASASGQVVSRSFDPATGTIGESLVPAHARGATSLLLSA